MTRKLAAIALLALILLTARWAVAHTYTLILWAAVISSVAVVAGPAIGKATRKARSAIAPKQQAPKQLTSEEIDWSSMVMGYRLPNERKDV